LGESNVTVCSGRLYSYRNCLKSRSDPVEFASNGLHVALSQHLLSL